MKKIIFVLFALFVCGGAYAQFGNVDKNWCPSRYRIDINGGLFMQRYISCPAGAEENCKNIVSDLQDLFQGAGAKANGYYYLPSDQQAANALINALRGYQDRKLQSKPQPFFYALDITAGMINIPGDDCKKEVSDGGISGQGFLFNVINTNNDKNLKNGKAPGGKTRSEYRVVIDLNARIYIY